MSDPLSIAYTLAGIGAGITTLIVGMRSVLKRSRKELGEAVAPLAEAADKLNLSLETASRGNKTLTSDVDNYHAVSTANEALRQVISDCTKQLAEAGRQLAENTVLLNATREELRACQWEKEQLTVRVVNLERKVGELHAVLGRDNPAP